MHIIKYHNYGMCFHHDDTKCVGIMHGECKVFVHLVLAGLNSVSVYQLCDIS